MEKPVKVLFLNSTDIYGGAARASYRLFEGLRELGTPVKMLVRDKDSSDPDVISFKNYERKGWGVYLKKIIWKIKNRIRKQKWKKYPDREPAFLNDLDSVSLIQMIKSIDFDILHIHFVANRFLDLHELTQINKPIVWTLHDSWPFTGICHYFYDCRNYEKSCGCCPMLHSENPNDFTRKIWKTKNKIYTKCKMFIVAPSIWIGKAANQSSLMRNFPLTVIPNGLNTQLYTPSSKLVARQYFGLKEGIIYVMFGAINALNDSNKGFTLLLNALVYLQNEINLPVELLIFGAEKDVVFNEISYPIHSMGIIRSDATLIQLYNSADVMVVPSLSEVFGQTASEAMSCGVPTVAFNCSGIQEVIDHKKTGYLAEPYDPKDLAKGIAWCIENNKDHTLSIQARKKVLENYEINKVCNQYIELYKTSLK